MNVCVIMLKQFMSMNMIYEVIEMMQSKAMVEIWVSKWCTDNSIEVVDVCDWDGPSWTGIEFNLYDWTDSDNHIKFKSDINNLVDYLEDILDADIFVRQPFYQILTDIDDDGNEIEKYHCFLCVGKNC